MIKVAKEQLKMLLRASFDAQVPTGRERSTRGGTDRKKQRFHGKKPPNSGLKSSWKLSEGNNRAEWGTGCVRDKKIMIIKGKIQFTNPKKRMGNQGGVWGGGWGGGCGGWGGRTT